MLNAIATNHTAFFREPQHFEFLAKVVLPPLYARWIAMYGGEEFKAVVDAVLAETDRIGGTLAEAELDRVREHFMTTSRYEWMFWDAGWRLEEWPV
jgi:thiaminase/transcriptional activator TenA